MPDIPPSPPSDGGVEAPKGTLVIMFLFGSLFALAWLLTYVLLFLERGAPHSH